MARKENVLVDEKKSIQVQMFHSFGELNSMRREWDEFIESLGGEIFLTFDWCCVWWKYYNKNRELLVMVFRKNGTICGILPLFRETIWLGPIMVRAIKIVGTDFSIAAITVPIRVDCLGLIIKNVLNDLKNVLPWDIMHFGPICGRYESFGPLLESCSGGCKGSYQIKVKKSDVQTYFKIANSWEEQLSTLSYKNRRQIRAKYENILKQGGKIECIAATKDNFGVIFDKFVKMHQIYWNRKKKAGHFGAWPLSYEFHKEMARIQLNANRLRLFEIRLDNKIIGYHYCYKLGDTYYYFLFARAESKELDKEVDFIRIDFGEMVKRALKEGVKTFDSMRGEYEFKMRLGGELFPMKNIYFISGRLESRIRVFIFRYLAFLTDICYHKIWRSRIMPRFGIKGKAFWEKWIRFQSLGY